MAKPFKLPDLGEGIHEGEVLAVRVSVGDEVNEGDIILEVETDKAAVEIPSPYTGTVEEILVKPGDTVQVGDVLMTFSGEGEGEVVEAAKTAEKAPEPAVPAPVEAPPTRAEGPVPASPATRKLARELGIDLHMVTPTGPGGLVTAEDVKAYSERGVGAKEVTPSVAAPTKRTEEPKGVTIAAPDLPDFSRWGEIERIPVRSIRKATAKQMTLAWSQIPHVHNQDSVDMTKLEKFRQRHKKEIEARGGKLTPTVFALKAVATALKTLPQFNATYDVEAGEIIRKHYFHIGVAVNTDEGLVVPVVRDVDRKSIIELSAELYDLVMRARDRKIKLEEMQGGTFTITNVGPMGGGYFAPIINYPEVAIMGMGSASMQPVVKEKEEGGHEMVPRLIMPVVLCIDHRVLDGADAIAFLRNVIEALEDPDELLMTMI